MSTEEENDSLIDKKSIQNPMHSEKTIDPEKVTPSEDVPWGEILTSTPVWALGIAKFGFYYSFFMVVTWLPSYLHEMGMKEHTAAYMSAVPFGLTVPFVIFFGILKNTLHAGAEDDPNRNLYKPIGTKNASFRWSLKRTRKTLACICYTGNIGCFAALTRIPVGKPWVAFWVVNIMYVLNASFIAGVAVNVIDIGAKYAGSIMALTHEFAAAL